MLHFLGGEVKMHEMTVDYSNTVLYTGSVCRTNIDIDFVK